jgi:hypothetical protein
MYDLEVKGPGGPRSARGIVGRVPQISRQAQVQGQQAGSTFRHVRIWE